MPPVRPHLPPRPIAAVRLDGGRPCLDFVNTIHDRYAVEVEDYLQQPQRFAEWCTRAGVLHPDDGVRAPRAARERAALMREVETLRRHLHALFAARVDELPLPADAARALDRWLHRAWEGQSLGADGQLHWRADACDARLPLKRIALDALDLLAQFCRSLCQAAILRGTVGQRAELPPPLLQFIASIIARLVHLRATSTANSACYP